MRAPLLRAVSIIEVRMRIADLAVAIRASYEDVFDVRMSHELVEQGEAAESAHCRSSRKSASGCSAHAKTTDELPKRDLEAILGLDGRQFRHARLVSHEERDLGDHVENQLAVTSESGEQT